jgi:hypothetical protein
MEAFKHHVRLVVEEELDTDLIKTYYNTVKEHLGETVQPNEEDVTMVHHLMDDAHCYDINLAEDMDAEQGDNVAEALNKLIDENTDFLIEGTNSLELEANLDDVNEDINENDYEHLAQDFAKYRHNRWVDHKFATGWRYGQEINEEEQTHPHLINWDALPESIRTVDGNLPSMFMSLLGHKGYGIHQK